MKGTYRCKYCRRGESIIRQRSQEMLAKGIPAEEVEEDEAGWMWDLINEHNAGAHD